MTGQDSHDEDPEHLGHNGTWLGLDYLEYKTAPNILSHEWDHPFSNEVMDNAQANDPFNQLDLKDFFIIL